MTAAHMGQVDLMKLLLARSADVSAREKRFGQTALMLAGGNPAAVRLLVERVLYFTLFREKRARFFGLNCC